MKRRDHLLLSQCSGCGADDRFLVHSVFLRGANRRLCTDCLLKNHQGLFCPFCFHVYEEDSHLAPHQRLVCLRCPSISHLACVPSSYSRAPPSFLCPSCSSPDFSFFTLTNKKIKPSLDHSDVIDSDSAAALVAASRIAAVSMTKAAAQARLQAERRVKEAALARSKATEALEKLAYLAAIEKETKDKDAQQHKVDNNQAIDDGGAVGKKHSRNGAVAVQRQGN